MKDDQLVFIQAISENGKTVFTGTGYFITPALILTANHTFKTALKKIAVRVEGTGEWLECKPQLVWNNAVIDAALLQTTTSRPNIETSLYDEDIPDNAAWQSKGYPMAALEEVDAVQEQGMLSVKGTINATGSKADVRFTKLDLTVDADLEDTTDWQGMSGSPIFIGDRLVGIIKAVQMKIRNRLTGIAITELLKDAGFRAALDSGAAIPAVKNWSLIITAENSDIRAVLGPARTALRTYVQDDNAVLHEEITSILASPGKLLRAVEMMCKAPLLIIDGTNYQPGIMLLLGIRAVVRRGITIVVTTKPVTEEELTKIPFNIQEIKLVALGKDVRDRRGLSPRDRLELAVTEGKNQAGTNPGYLDLPAFDAVRNPVSYNIPAIREKALILCSFANEYEDHFDYLNGQLGNIVDNTRNIIRMTDIASPQLVGQSLYEHIRWAKYCIIDWTQWPKNVFYELGVRLASSDIPPINVIENGEATIAADTEFAKQKKQLLQLFRPYKYELDSPWDENIDKHYNAISGNNSYLKNRVYADSIYYDNIYVTAEKNFDAEQQRAGQLPHEEIQQHIEREYGKDTMMAGRYNVLYSKQNAFNKTIQQHIREYWLAAWYYLSNRYPKNRFAADEPLLSELNKLGQKVIDALDTDEYAAMRKQVNDFLNEFKKTQNDQRE